MNTQRRFTVADILLWIVTLLGSILLLVALCHTDIARAQNPADALPTLADHEGVGASNGELVSCVVAIISGLIAIWKHTEASTAQKVIKSVILGVEEATKLPEVQAVEQRVKQTIRQKSVDFGVQDTLHAAVNDLTDS